MSGDQLNLDAIEETARMAEPDPYCLPADAATVLALVAELRMLREELRLEQEGAANLCPHGWWSERCEKGCAPRYIPWNPRQ